MKNEEEEEKEKEKKSTPSEQEFRDHINNIDIDLSPVKVTQKSVRRSWKL